MHPRTMEPVPGPETAEQRSDTLVMKPEYFAALQRVTHHAHPGANRAEKRAAWRKHRRYATRPAPALVET